MNQKSSFVCQQCSYESARWFGKCPECGEWNSAVETLVSTAQSAKGKARRTNGGKPVTLASIPTKSTSRISTKISELDRVLGGGLVSGQVVLIAGEPGIGKSTLLLQVADFLSDKKDMSTLYVSGEESAAQIKVRADRLGIKNENIKLLEETDIDAIINSIDSTNVLIVDSIQTMATSDLSGMAGSVGQVRECAFRLVRIAKSKNIPVFIVGHVTKQGSVAGPSVLMHIVDSVLWFEGDKTLTYRLVRAVKNRFGPTDEVGIFSMEDKGLISMDNPEKMFLTKRNAVPGSVASLIMQGTRPMLVEIQALVVSTKMAFPRRVAQGIDSKKFELLLAVLTRRCGLPLNDYDCYISVSGGITLRNDPSADLAVCLAVASAYFDKALPERTVAIGEIDLLGSIREVIAQEKRIKEAKRLGYINSITSKTVLYMVEAIKSFLK